jgi:hypothetical protein
MLIWGPTLRHGWGCVKNESLDCAVQQGQAQAALGDLERARAGLDMSVLRGELVLAIYEVGLLSACFRTYAAKARVTACKNARTVCESSILLRHLAHSPLPTSSAP